MTQAILAKYHGPTNVKGSRISATCQGGRVVVSFDSALNFAQNYAAAAEALVRKMGWTPNHGTAFAGRWIAGGLPDGSTCFVFSSNDYAGHPDDSFVIA